MYVRAFDVRRIRIASMILEGIVLAWAVAIIILCIFRKPWTNLFAHIGDSRLTLQPECTPVAKAWNPTIKGTCINLRGSFIGNAVPNIVTDILILALPIHALWQLDTNFWLKMQLSFVFLLGSFVVFTAIYRFTTLFAFNQLDTTWTLATSCAWVVVEVASGVISVCLPTLGPLLSCGAWRERSRAVRSGSGLTSIDKTGSLPTKVYAVRDVEDGRAGVGFERVGRAQDEDLTGMVGEAYPIAVVGRGRSGTLATMHEEVEGFELKTQTSRGEKNNEAESERDVGWYGGRGLAPPRKNTTGMRY